jgi:hypothetical protein
VSRFSTLGAPFGAVTPSRPPLRDSGWRAHRLPSCSFGVRAVYSHTWPAPPTENPVSVAVQPSAGFSSSSSTSTTVRGVAVLTEPTCPSFPA